MSQNTIKFYLRLRCKFYLQTWWAMHPGGHNELPIISGFFCLPHQWHDYKAVSEWLKMPQLDYNSMQQVAVWCQFEASQYKQTADVSHSQLRCQLTVRGRSILKSKAWANMVTLNWSIVQKMSCIIQAEAPISLNNDGKGRGGEEGEGKMLNKQDT